MDDFEDISINKKYIDPQPTFSGDYIPPAEVYPMWSHAIEKIRERFDNESYGFIITHEELKKLMGIQPAKTVEEVKKEQLDYMTGIEKTKQVLLEDYNLCLWSVQSIGYQVIHPEEQIRTAADYYIQKSQKALSKSMSMLTNIDRNLLGFQDQELQLLKMNRIAWVKSAFRRRKLPQPADKKQIT